MKYLKDRALFLFEKVASEIENLLTKKKCYKKGSKWYCDKKLLIGSNRNRVVLINSIDGENVLKVKFGIIKGDFSLATNNKDGRYPLTKCIGFPTEVHGDLMLGHNKLKDLKNFPKRVDGEIKLNDNKITNLKGLPSKVNGNILRLDDTLITSLKGLPEECPAEIHVSNTKLENLKHLPNAVKKVYIYGCRNMQTISDIVGRDLKIEGYNALNKKINSKIVECEVGVYKPNIEPEKFFSKLIVQLVKNKIDPKEYKYWPKGFLNKNVAKSANSIHKYSL